MGDNSNKLIISNMLVIFIVLLSPIVIIELFPLSVYPMLSDKWDGYSTLESASKDPVVTMNSPYFGIPMGLPVGRSYSRPYLEFGVDYDISTLKKILIKKNKSGSCFKLNKFGTLDDQSFGLIRVESFCLD